MNQLGRAMPSSPPSHTWNPNPHFLLSHQHHWQPSPFHRQLAGVLPPSRNHFRNVRPTYTSCNSSHLHHAGNMNNSTTVSFHTPSPPSRCIFLTHERNCSASITTATKSQRRGDANHHRSHQHPSQILRVTNIAPKNQNLHESVTATTVLSSAHEPPWQQHLHWWRRKTPSNRHYRTRINWATVPHAVGATTSFCETLIWEREGAATCHTLNGHWMVKVCQIWSKWSNLVKDWSKKREYRIKNGLLRKLMQILFVNNLLDIFI